MEKEQTFCPMGCHAWCGRPCKWDPEKGNALLFHADGREKSLEERGLGWSSPPLVQERVRRSIEDLRGVVAGKFGPGAVTKIVTEKGAPLRKSVTEKAPVTEMVVSRLKAGRPKKKGALSAAERMRAMRAKAKPVKSGD